MRSGSLSQASWRAVLFGLLLVSSAAAAQDELEVRVTPGEITAPFISGIGGTELVTIEVVNRAEQPVEMPPQRWLVIEREDRPGKPCFTPLAPFTPLVIEPGETLTSIWRLRESTDVHLGSGTAARPAAVAAGLHHIDVYYRLAGEEHWRRKVVSVELKKLPWLWIGLGALVVVVGVVWFLVADD
ncbi:MAG: hypothetical protein GY856_46850 [bacterium]|nr:hypothetical protein [bacterium]